jgi:hypothetical protein
MNTALRLEETCTPSAAEIMLDAAGLSVDTTIEEGLGAGILAEDAGVDTVTDVEGLTAAVVETVSKLLVAGEGVTEEVVLTVVEDSTLVVVDVVTTLFDERTPALVVEAR